MVESSVKPIWILGIVILLALFRFVPHPPNVTPIAAMALFAGAFFVNRLLAYSVPIAVMVISDLVLGFHSTIIYVYTGVLVTVIIGSQLKKINFLSISTSAVVASIVFFLLTNFGAWLHHDMYTQNFSGLLQAYVAGIPFLRNALIANLLFSYLVFFGFSSFFNIKPVSEST